jgi:anti-sigma factor ChrR (cupin superfamily)
MRTATEVNADPNLVAVMNTNQMAWEPTEWPGISRKVLEFVNHPRMGRETALLKFAPGAAMPTAVLVDRLDVFVVEGEFTDEQGSYGTHTFIRNQPGTSFTPVSAEGCVLYMKWRVPIRPGGQRLVIDAKTAKWMEFPHRGADVLHLYPNSDGIETGRIGHVHTNRKLPSHDHSIGEETFVLKGCLSDEFAAHGQGVWFRMPCGKAHAPFTGDERCMMLIREGDLVW